MNTRTSLLRRARIVGLLGIAGGLPAQPPSAPKALLEPVREHVGERDGAAFGVSLAIVGDVNRDGHPDYAVGAPRDRSLQDRDGSVAVFSGKDGRLLYLHRGAERASAFGYAVAGGDFDDDGWSDLAVGAPYASKPDEFQVGNVQVFSGKDGQLLRTLWGPHEGAAYGWALASIDNLDGDGKAGLAIGAPYADRGRPSELGLDAGCVDVYAYGRHKVLYTIWGEHAEDRSGSCVATLDDVDDDRVADLLIGSEGTRDGQHRPGSARVCSGRKGKVIHVLRGEGDDYFGTSVCGLGDLDGDGRADFAVGAWNATGDADQRPGQVRIFSGRSARELRRLVGTAHRDRFGRAIVGVGDIDGDGAADLAVGAPAEDAPGAVRILSGRSYAVIAELRGASAGAEHGSVLGAADFDGDGFLELVVGSPRARVGVDAAGTVTVYSKPAAGRDGR